MDLPDDIPEAEKLIIAAAQEQERAERTADLMADVRAGRAEIMKHVYNPQARHFRSKARGAATRGEIPQKMKECPHPFSLLQQFIDDDPAVVRSGRMTNLFECGQCGCLLWLVDPWGEEKGDV